MKAARTLHNILHGIHLVRERNPTGIDAMATLVSFSDSVVFSSDNLVYILGAANGLQRTLLEVGMLCRGAIAFGALHHSGSVVFGPALVRAYRVETTAAVYPRIIIDDSIVGRLKPAVRDQLLEQDADGLWFTPMFRDWPRMQDPKGAVGLGSLLVAGFREVEPTRDAGVIAKWHWMIRRFNVALKEVQPEMTPIEVRP